MLKSTPQLSEIVSLTVMLLMVVALVAAQADTPAEPLAGSDAARPALKAESGHFRLEDE